MSDNYKSPWDSELEIMVSDRDIKDQFIIVTLVSRYQPFIDPILRSMVTLNANFIDKLRQRNAGILEEYYI